MTEEDYKHFVCIAAGDNTKELMKKYDKNKKVAPYIVYKFSEVKNIKEKYIAYYQAILNNEELYSAYNPEEVKNTIEYIKTLDENKFFKFLLTNDDLSLDKDNNIVSISNPDGKFSYFAKGKILSVPFLTKDGREVFEAKKSEIDWDIMQSDKNHVYERVWEMVMENSEPLDEHEKLLYDNMKDKTYYLNKFENKENYVISNTAFWGYAFMSEITGWREATELDSQFDWMKNFYNVFIKNLPDDTLLTIYECIR